MVLGRIATVAGAVVVIFGGTLGVAGHALADDDDAAGGATYVMPDITGMYLDDAIEAVTEMNSEFEITARNINGTPKPLVEQNWTVCWQYPSAGDGFEEDSWMGAGVTRKGTDCWG